MRLIIGQVESTPVKEWGREHCVSKRKEEQLHCAQKANQCFWVLQKRQLGTTLLNTVLPQLSCILSEERLALDVIGFYITQIFYLYVSWLGKICMFLRGWGLIGIAVTKVLVPIMLLNQHRWENHFKNVLS